MVIKMFNFFCKENNRLGDCYLITGADYNHIKNVLRMNIGDRFLVSFEANSDLCEIIDLKNETVTAKILEENYKNTNLPINIYLFQGSQNNYAP